MSRKASLLTVVDVPKYIRQIACRLRPVDPKYYTDQCVPGYTFDLYGKYKIGYEEMLETECEKLLFWAKSWHADAYVLQTHYWDQDVSHREYEPKGGRNHRFRAYRQGFRNHIRVVITDPVAHRFEKDKFYR